jgi:hypothetical protein
MIVLQNVFDDKPTHEENIVVRTIRFNAIFDHLHEMHMKNKF